MTYKLKCKHCGYVSYVKLEELESNKLHQCPECKNIMCLSDATRLSNLLKLIDFEIIEICYANSYNYLTIEEDLTAIKQILNDGNEELNELLVSIIERVYLAIRNKDLNQISKLNDVIHNFILKRNDDKQKEMGKLLGIPSYSIENFIEYIIKYIPEYSLTEKTAARFRNMYRQYNEDYDFLTECVDLSAERYLEYDEDNKPTVESVNEFLNKIGGIAYNRSNKEE